MSLGSLLVPRQPRKNSLSGQPVTQPANLKDEPQPGVEPSSTIQIMNTTNQARNEEQKQARLVVPAKMIKPVSGQPSRPSPARLQTQHSATTPKKVLKAASKHTVMSSISSIVSTQKHQIVAPVKLQKLDQELLRKSFYTFTGEFAIEVDLYFKNYNRFIKETKNKIDVQVKASKREKLMHAQFLNREEIKFWKEFPRSLKFYHSNLRSIKQGIEPASAAKSSRLLNSNAVEVRDIDQLILTALDFQPFASWKFCQLFSVEQSPMLTDEAWRNASLTTMPTGSERNTVGSDQYSMADANESFTALGAPQNISTFDTLTEALKMFDSDDAQNWRVLGLTAMLLVADTIALILEQPSTIQKDADRRSKKDQLPPISISPEVTAKLIEFCRRFASLRFPQDPAEEELDELTIVDILFDKVQFTWANKIFPSLSTLSTMHFDMCLKFLQRALQNDHRQITDEAKEVFIQEIYFGRYLAITPENVNMADKVLGLLEKFIQMLGSEHCSDDFKLGLLATLKYLVESLCFYDSEVCNKRNILPLRGCAFDPNAMQVQAASVARIYAMAESLAARQSYREHAVLLMATILKISQEDFVEQKWSNFLSLIKFSGFFKNKKTYAMELKICNQLYITGPIHLQKYKAWQPKVHQKDRLMIENRAFKVLTPVVDLNTSMAHISLGRKLSLRSVPQNLIPQALHQPRGSRYLIISLPDYFHMIFNAQLVGLKTCPVDYTHWQFVEQAVYDDFEFMAQQGIPYLLEQRWTDLGIPLLNLGLKLADYVLSPNKDFREKYYELHGGISSPKGMMLGQQIKTLRSLVCQTLKHIFRSELHLNSDFMTKQLAFYRDVELKSLCNDSIAAIWSRPDHERVLQKPAEIAKDLKSQDMAKFHLQERHRLITFEDLNEINSNDFKYENNYLNILQRDIDHFTSKTQWDKKKEKFVRQRLCCFVAQQAGNQLSQRGQSSPLTKLPGAVGQQQRQSTTFYSELPAAEREQIHLLRQMLKMVPYLPEMHNFFKFSPTKHIIREQNALLTNRVKPINFPSEEQEESKEEQDAGSLSNSAPKRVSVEENSSDSEPKLAEVQKLLPHYMLSLDYGVAEQTMKCMLKTMVTGDLSMRISLIDQMIYFIKELMLESPEEHLVTQSLQLLTKMITIWHQSETIKFQATTDREIRPGHKLSKYMVFDLVSAGGESLQATALDDAARNMYKELHQHLQMFDLLDMVSTLGLCSKDIFARSLSCILIQETGKLKRLLVHKDKQRYILADLLYYNRDKMIETLVRRVSIFYGLKGQGTKSQEELARIFERLQFYQFVVDNFEYQRFGLWESLVRDIQVIYIGDLVRMWKETLLKHTRVGGVILHYIQHLSGTSLALFESKQGGVQDPATQVSSAQRDFAGLNLLLAIVLFNVTKSHQLRNRILKVGEQQPLAEDSDEEREEVFSSGKLTTNTIMEEAVALIAHTETNFNHMHKISFSTFYPARLWTSNILMSFLFYLQTPLDQKSLRNLNEIFIVKRLDFQPGEQKQQQFVENCLIFFTLLMANPNQQFTSYVLEQLEQETRLQEEQVSLQASAQMDSEIAEEGGYPISKSLSEMCAIFTNTLEAVELTDDAQGKKKFILRISMAHSICTCIQKLREATSNRVRSTDYLSRDQQISLLQETRSQFKNVSENADQKWLCPLIKEIWFCLISFEAIIGGNLNLLDDVDGNELQKPSQPKLIVPAKLIDLKFLIQLEQDGFTGALKYYKFFHLLQFESGSGNPRLAASNDPARIAEIKLLIQHVYAFFGNKRQPQKPVLPDAPLQSDLSMISGFSADVSHYSRYPDQPVKVQKNVYFKCLVNCVIDTIALCKALESLRAVPQEEPSESEHAESKLTSAAQLAKSTFAPVYSTLANSIFKQSKANLESRLRKFCQSNLHSKIFLVSLFVSLNSTDKIFIEKARILTLAILPLMFPDLTYRKIVEEKIIAHAQTSQIKQLISHENKHFYQFIKRIFLGEERYNMEHHFEKYFSLSGFLRDILNEIIKLQAAESDQPQIAPKMLLKVLDIVTYFFSGNIDLRRAPSMPSQTHSAPLKGSQMLSAAQATSNDQGSESFIFANLIDYKSFEFLSKLYKISEKLVDHDNDLLIMNMWYKVVENRPQNFEILTKFLIHNLSSFIMKLRATSNKESQNQSQTQSRASFVEEDSYGIEYEKQKRYSLSIFNYIKARTQQIDIRNSLNVASVCSWSQKMIKVVVRAQLNLHSKYSLEKMKLKEILQSLHQEINQSGFTLQPFKGFDALTSLLGNAQENQQDYSGVVGAQGSNFDDVRRSYSMNQLLESRTFVSTFGGHNKQDKGRMKQLLFVIERQMSEKFDELTPDNQIMQLPDLVIKYYENALIMIANESERLQIIKYSLKEELTITIIIILLIADLATKQCEINRFYFMYDLLNKLTLNIGGIQRYLKLHMLSMEQFQSITTEEEVLAVFNYRSILDHFGVFSHIYFQLLHNTVAVPILQKFLLNLWQLIFERVQALLSKGEGQQRLRDSVIGCQAPHFSRLPRDGPDFDFHESNGPRAVRIHGLLTMLKGCFFTLHQYSIKSARARESDVFSSSDLRCVMQNFISHVKCVMEYVLPSQLKSMTLKDFSDPFAPEISFATNAAFWLSFACLEMSAVASSAFPIDDTADLNETVTSQATNQRSMQRREGSLQNHLLGQIQELGMTTMRRILEESDFLKLLIGIQKLSPHFYSYSLSVQSGKTALLPLLFAALENPASCEDAYKSLIVTIRIQDSHLLMTNSEESKRAESELHRFLLLVPFFYQQFLGYEHGAGDDDVRANANSIGIRKSTTIFTNKKSIIQLLKKSLLSVGIDKKKEILNILDEIQLEVDQGDPKKIRDLFGSLVGATCQICLAQNCHPILQEALKTFRAIASSTSVATNTIVIESQIIQQTISQTKAVLARADLDDELVDPRLHKEVSEYYSCQSERQKLLGEELINVKKEIRPLYFGLKNIIFQEIGALDQPINVRAFFIEEEAAGFPSGAAVPSRQRSHYVPGAPLGEMVGQDGSSSDIASTSHHQQAQNPTAGYPTQATRAKKQSQQKKEMVSKYQNSQNALAIPQAIGNVNSNTLLAINPKVGPSANYAASSKAWTEMTNYQMHETSSNRQVQLAAEEPPEQREDLLRPQTTPVGVGVGADSDDQAYTYSQTTAGGLGQAYQPTQSQQTLLTAVRGAAERTPQQKVAQAPEGEQEIGVAARDDVSRRSSKIWLDDEERKIQQENLSQILFENDDDEADDQDRAGNFRDLGVQPQKEEIFRGEMTPEKLSNIDVALAPTLQAAKSFAESVLEEEQKYREHQSEQKPAQQYEFHPKQDFNVANETSNEIDGLLGTFAKPAHAQAHQRQQSDKVVVPSLQLSEKKALMAGEVPMNGEFNFSQAMSSIEVGKTDREMHQRAALIPGFANERANEMIDETDSQDKFGTGDFPSADQMAQLRQQQRFHTVNNQNYKFATGQGELQSVLDPEQVRLSQLDARQRDEKLQTQKFDARTDFHTHQVVDPRMRTAGTQPEQALANMPAVKTGKAANFLTSQHPEELPTPKKLHAIETILIEVLDDEEEFYELENFLGEEKNYDVDSLAFYVKVMEFKKETNGLNSTLAAGMIIDNYLAEDAQYYIGNEIKNDTLINRLIGEYEQVVVGQMAVPKDIFDGVCEQIVQQLLPLLLEFKARGRLPPGAATHDAPGFSHQF